MTDELSPSQEAELAADLNELETSLTALLEATEKGEQPVMLKDNAGRLSRMDELHRQSILKANRNLTKRRLQQVMKAKLRLTEGVYGFCTECDEPVSFQRLKAYPEAPRCIECQSEQE